MLQMMIGVLLLRDWSVTQIWRATVTRCVTVNLIGVLL